MLGVIFPFLVYVGVPLLLIAVLHHRANHPADETKTAAPQSKREAISSNNTDNKDKNKNKNKKKDATKPTATTAAPQQQQQQQQHVDPAIVPPAENKTKDPKILIAYATNTQGALTLAHKLFSQLTNELARLHGGDSFSSTATATAAAAGCCGGNAFSSTNEAANGDENGGGCCCTATSAPREASTAVVPVVKVLELTQDSPHGCTIETLMEDPSYVLVIFVVSTFTGGTAPPRSQTLEGLLKDAYEDHRVPRDALAKKRFAVFGLGDSAYGDAHFCTFAKNLHTWCRGMGCPHFVVPPVYATEAKVSSLFGVFSTALLKWVSRATFHSDGSLTVQRSAAANGASAKSRKSAAGAPVASKPAALDGGVTAVGAAEAMEEEEEESESGSEAGNDEGLEDVEDLIWDGEDDDTVDLSNPDALPELLYPKLRENLTKQGYHLVGSHSGVKLCRWTKAMMRGRGGCYKHTFYDINSSQCMEMTPSLACANKCIFCWRHHTNPVSRNFRWKQDPPELLVAEGMAGHYKMVNQMRGVPGVTPERFAQAMKIRHCALSLVGEPIMYPQINEFCDLLHAHHISSFMVTNAQFPEQLRNLKPVVQLYLSIDAPTPEELHRVDRPLFEDYWERCLSCVQELRKKKQRTVFRLTLVNEYNNENIAAYADLVQMGWPDFIEVKGVTYCGTSNSSTLTMKNNVPRHDEVIGFCQALCAKIASNNPTHQAPTMAPEACPKTLEEDPDVIVIPEAERNWPYHIACEHEHSCCVLIALDQFYVDQRWHTWINYEKFYELVESGRQNFTSLEYGAPTPAWATYKSAERGFDPEQTRVMRKNAKPRPVSSGC